MTAARNWAGNVTFRAARVHRPTSVEQLQEIVAASPRLRVLGTGHSFSRVADTDGDLVRTDGLREGIAVDTAAQRVVVPGGARYGEVALALHEHGLALPNLGSLPHISVAGACATGTHGSGDANQCLAAAATAIEFVRADGELVRVEAGDPDFAGSVLALGAHGVVTSMTLAAGPTFDIVQQVWLDAPLERLVENFDAVMSSGYSVSIFSRTARPEVVDQVWIKTRVDSPLADGREWGAFAANTVHHPIAGQDAHAVTEQLGLPGPWHERLPHFRLDHEPSAGDEQQSEFMVPRANGPAALAGIHRLGLGDVLLALEVRTVAADDLWLSPCGGRDTVAVHFTWRNDDAAVRAAVARVEGVLGPLDARPHWGKVFTLDPSVVRAHYPRRAEFAALAARHDPNRTFGNEFLDTYVY